MYSLKGWALIGSSVSVHRWSWDNVCSSVNSWESCVCYLCWLLRSSASTVSEFTKLLFILNLLRLEPGTFHLSNHWHFVLWYKFSSESEISMDSFFFQLKWRLVPDSLVRHPENSINITLQSNRLNVECTIKPGVSSILTGVICSFNASHKVVGMYSSRRWRILCVS
jgi:hypothetical protein